MSPWVHSKAWLRFGALALLLALPALADDERDPESVCTAEQGRCADACTIDYGTSYELRAKFETCQAHCVERHDLCLLKFIAKREIAHPKPAEGSVVPAAKTETPKPTEAAPYMLPRTRYTEPEPAPAPPPSTESATPAEPPAAEEAPPEPAPARKKPEKKHHRHGLKESIAPKDGD